MPPKRNPSTAVEVVNANTLRLLVLGYSRSPHKVPSTTARVWTDEDMTQAASAAAVHINKTASKLVPQGTPMSEDDLVNAVRALIETAPASASPLTVARKIVRAFKEVRLTS